MESSFPKVRMSATDVAIFKRDIIDKRKNKFEVWPFAYGDEALGVTSMLNSAYVVYCFRRKLKLGHHARLTCFLPVMGLSALFADAFHDNYINHKILQGGCSVCTEVKASLGQALMSCIYPLAFAPVISFYMADRMFTYPTPPISAPKEIFNLWQKIVRPNATTFLTLCGIQMIFAMYVTREKFNTIPILDINRRF